MSLRIDWLVGFSAACALGAASASGQTRSPDGEASPNQSEARTYQPGETYYESNLNRNLGSTENALQTQYRQTAQSQQQLWQDLAAHRQAVRDYEQTKTELLREYNQSPEIMAARKNLAVAEQEYREARATAIQRLELRREYRDAVTQRQGSSAMLKQLTDEPITSTARQHFSQKLTDAMLLIKELEEQAINADSAAGAALRERQAILQEIARLKSISRESMAADSRFTSATIAKERTRNKVQLQQREVAGKFQQLVQMQRGYQQLVQRRLSLEQYQRANSWASWRW